jgi:acetyltransferase-like isoleucine patch superfamily enzyme
MLRPMRFMLRRISILVSCPGVNLGSDVRVSSGVRVRATDGGQIEIGNECDLSRYSEIIAKHGILRVGPKSFIGPFVVITAKERIEIGRDSLIAERVTIRDQDHDIRGPLDVPIAQAGFRTAPIMIGDGAWIGAGAVILKGVRIGRGAVIAANAVVNQDVADFEVVGGVPSCHLGWRGGEGDEPKN